MRIKFPFFLVAGLCSILIVLTACSTETATPTATHTAAFTPTSIPSPTPTSTPTPSPEDAWQEGEELYHRSDFAGAIQAFERAIEIDSAYGPAYTSMSMVYLSQEIKYDEALAHAQKGVEFAPESSHALAVLSLAQSWMYATSDAIASAEKAAELEPEDAFVQAVLALAYLYNNQYDDAYQAAQRAYELDDRLPFALYVLGDYYWQTADFGRALASLEEAARLEPEFADWQELLGDLYLDSGRYPEAGEAFERALVLAPDYLPSILGFADLGVAQKEYEAAEAHLEKARELAPDEPAVFITTGYLYLDQDEYEDALEQFNRALELSPEDFDGRYGVGRVYLFQDECEQARQQFQELASDYPTWASPRINRGWADVCAGNLDRAMTHFRDAVELDPYSSWAQGSLGWGYMYQQRPEDANQAFVEALHLSLFPAYIHEDLGQYFWRQGLLEQAEVEFKLAEQIDPYSTDIKLRLGELLLDQERFDEAAVYAEEALALAPADKDALSFRGMIYNIQGQPEEAVDILRQALEKAPDEPQIHLHLGLAYRDLGDYSEASSEIETYLALVGDGLPEYSNNLLTFLVESLNQGYTISQEKALDEIEAFLTFFLGSLPEINIEDLEDGGLTLVLEQPLTTAEMEQEVYFETSGLYVGITSLYMPRVDPLVENGLSIRFTRTGKEWLTVDVSLLTLKRWADTLLAPELLVEYMDFTLADDILPDYSIETMVRDLSTMIELDSIEIPPYQTISTAEVQDHFESSFDQEVSASIQDDSAVLQMLGLISPTVALEDVLVDLYTEQVAGFYVPEEGQIYLVELEESSPTDQVVLAHEVVHALQDQTFDLEELDNKRMNDDQVLAVDALVEGSATLASMFYLQEYIPDIILLEAASKAGDLEIEALDTAPDFISGMLGFPYSSGLEFVRALYEREEWETVNQSFTDLPLSTEQVLHPERYFSADAPVVVNIPGMESAYGDLWQEAGRNVMGEYGLLLYLGEFIGPAAAMRASEGWGGDSYLLLRNDSEDASVLVMQTSWDDQDEADEFWRLFRTGMYHRRAYTEIVESFVGESPTRIWQSDAGYLLAEQDEGDISILIGKDLILLKDILSILSE